MIERQEPWLTEDANQILQKIVSERRDLRVFEFGSGASTIWFSKQKNVKTLISVEHNIDWIKKVKAGINLGETLPKIELIFQYIPYNTAIDIYGMFDIILVDGRNRVKCIESALPHLKDKGVLILDNSEREYYQKGIDLMKNFDRLDTFQPKPDKYGFTYPGWTTSFFFKPTK